jgi:dTDP-4-amino-4,6-dideoxygalactose transaminase
MGFNKTLLTTSCTDALEMCTLLLDIKPGDRVIMPSFNFVSAANAFALRGASIDFADIDPYTLNINPQEVERLIVPDTRALVIVHYGGVACDMEALESICKKHKIALIEDAALAFDSWYTFSDGSRKRLGSIGDLATFSFHETKNIICGEGGALVINKSELIDKAEIIREKGTDRSKLFRGEIDKYTWQELGSSFLPSDINAAYLYAQLEKYKVIINRRIEIWNLYNQELLPLQQTGKTILPQIPDYASVNGQMYWLLCKNEQERDGLLKYLNERQVKAVFHYLPLHSSPWYTSNYPKANLEFTDSISSRIVRLPLYYELQNEQVAYIADAVRKFF